MGERALEDGAGVAGTVWQPMTTLTAARPSRALVAGVFLLLVAGAWWQGAPPAGAATTRVAVQSTETTGQYAPASVTVVVGDTVTWVWEGDNHSVTHSAPPGEPRQFDSGCTVFVGAQCGTTGDTFSHEFSAVGTYDYFCQVHPDMTGRVEVVEATASPSPTSPPKPTPTPEPTESPRPTETETTPPPGEPTTEPTEPAEQPSGTTAPTEPSPSPSPSVSPSSSPAPAPTEPPAPVPDPTFEAFPEAREPTDGEGDGDVEGDVALDGPADERSRTLWGIVGGVSVLGTLGAFGRSVLFGDPWTGSPDGG